MQRHIREAAPYARRTAPAKLIIVKMLINLALESARARSPSFSPLSPFSLMSSGVLFARAKGNFCSLELDLTIIRKFLLLAFVSFTFQTWRRSLEVSEGATGTSEKR